MKKLQRIIPIVIVLVLVGMEVWAQTPPPGGGGAPPPSAGAPIDGLTGLLLIAGIGYGARKIRRETVTTD